MRWRSARERLSLADGKIMADVAFLQSEMRCPFYNGINLLKSDDNRGCG